MAPKPTIVCQYHHHHHAFYLYMLSRGTDISKHTSSQNNYLTLHNFTITVTFTRLWISYFLNILLIADLNGRRRNCDHIGLSNYLWLFTRGCCRCDKCKNEMRHLSSKLIRTLKKLVMSPPSACCHQMSCVVGTAALYSGGLTFWCQPRDWLSWQVFHNLPHFW